MRDMSELSEKELEHLWNHEPGDILVTDSGRLLIVTVELFEEGFKNFFGDGSPIEYLLVNIDTGKLEATIDQEDLDMIWKIYDIRNIVKKGFLSSLEPS